MNIDDKYTLQKLIADNLHKIDYSSLDQRVHGKGHYENLSLFVCNMLKLFTPKFVEETCSKLPIYLKDTKMVHRWWRSLSKTRITVDKGTLRYFEKLLKIKILDITLPDVKQNVFDQMILSNQKRMNKVYNKKIKEYLESYEVKHISGNQKQFTSCREFFKAIFPDSDNDNMFGLVTNMNNTQKCYFNDCRFFTNGQDIPINKFTHWCINRPYYKSKEKFEGICENDIFNARYFLIEIDEGLSVIDQIKFADLLIDFGIPVKMVTYSGSRSIHIIIDLSIGILNRCEKKGLLSHPGHPEGIRNYTNVTFKQLLPKFLGSELEKYFGTHDVNEYFKNYIKEIYNIIFSLGIKVDFSCKNLNRWSRIPDGVRKNEVGDHVQTLLYFRQSGPTDEDVLEQFKNLEGSLKDKMNEEEEKFLNL